MCLFFFMPRWSYFNYCIFNYVCQQYAVWWFVKWCTRMWYRKYYFFYSSVLSMLKTILYTNDVFTFFISYNNTCVLLYRFLTTWMLCKILKLFTRQNKHGISYIVNYFLWVQFYRITLSYAIIIILSIFALLFN